MGHSQVMPAETQGWQVLWGKRIDSKKISFDLFPEGGTDVTLYTFSNWTIQGLLKAKLFPKCLTDL